MSVILSCLIILGLVTLFFNIVVENWFMIIITVISLLWLIGLAIKYY